MNPTTKAVFACFSLLILILIAGCSKGKEDPANPSVAAWINITGKAQKGPFITGTTITLNELNDNLGQTGRSFTTTILSDDGGFALNNIESSASMVLLTANGYFFHEIYGELSFAPLTLQALATVKQGTTINVNLMTHLIKERIMALTASGINFPEARSQAQQELLSFFGISLPFGTDNFEHADISRNDEVSAALLAISVALQRSGAPMSQKPSLTAELTQLLAFFGNDFKDDGIISNTSIGDTILHNIKMADLAKVRQNLQQRYTDLGISASIPGFEKYVMDIQKHLSEKVYNEFFYPEKASPYITFQGDTTAWTDNLLNLNTYTYGTNRDYSVAAIVPFDSVLTVKFRLLSGQYSYTPMFHGWEKVQGSGSELVLRSTLQNTLITMPLGFHAYLPPSVVIEFYKNDETEPYRVKHLLFI